MLSAQLARSSSLSARAGRGRARAGDRLERSLCRCTNCIPYRIHTHTRPVQHQEERTCAARCCMHRTATRLLLRRRAPLLAPPPAANTTRRYLSLGTASTLFAASASASTASAAAASASSSSQTTNTSVPLPTAMNGPSAETVAPVVEGHSKKMHSKVVSVHGK